MRSVSRWRWHLDEVFVKVNGKRHYLWRAVDHEGEVLESFVTKRRDKRAALKFLKKAMRRYGTAEEIVTDRLPSYRAAMRALGCAEKQRTGRWDNNRIENCRCSPPFTRPYTTTSTRTEASAAGIISRATAPPLSPNGGRFLLPEAGWVGQRETGSN